MPISSPSFQPKDFPIQGATQVKITNLDMPLANTEYSLTLQSGLKQIVIRSRNITETKVAFVSGESSSNYVTIKPRAVLTLDSLTLTGVSIYLQANTVTVMEIVELF